MQPRRRPAASQRIDYEGRSDTLSRNLASGRTRWPNRDPIADPSFLLRAMHFDENLRPAILELAIREQANRLADRPLYLFVRNSPMSGIDLLGLRRWIGRCESASVSVWLGVLFVDCYLNSMCGVPDDQHYESFHVKAILGIFSGGSPISINLWDANFEMLDVFDHDGFYGEAGIWQVGAAIGKVGDSYGAMRLGNAEAKGRTFIDGFDLSAFAGAGRSWVDKWDVRCCAGTDKCTGPNCPNR